MAGLTNLRLEDCGKFKLLLSKLELLKILFCEALFPSVVAELHIVLAALQNQADSEVTRLVSAVAMAL